MKAFLSFHAQLDEKNLKELAKLKPYSKTYFNSYPFWMLYDKFGIF